MTSVPIPGAQERKACPLVQSPLTSVNQVTGSPFSTPPPLTQTKLDSLSLNFSSEYSEHGFTILPSEAPNQNLSAVRGQDLGRLQQRVSLAYPGAELQGTGSRSPASLPLTLLLSLLLTSQPSEAGVYVDDVGSCPVSVPCPFSFLEKES